MMDGGTHQLLDIVENRQLTYLRDYFSRYPKEARLKVHLAISDFYTPYRTLVRLFSECPDRHRSLSYQSAPRPRVYLLSDSSDDVLKKSDVRSKHLKKY